MLVGEGFKTGKMGVRSGYIDRQKNPKIFWAAIFYMIVVVGFLGFLLLG